MNANELADDLEYWFGNAGFEEHVAMLRQQQAEIEALKPYKQKIEAMEKAYDAHFKKALGHE